MQAGRGGQPEKEIEHGREKSREDYQQWLRFTPAGLERVKRIVDFITAECRLAPRVELLECGSGVGIFSRLFAESGAQVTATDISPELLEKGRELSTFENLSFVETNLEDPANLEDGYYDAVCGVSVLHHLNCTEALKAIRPKLKSGARFAFSEPNMNNPLCKHYYYVPDPEKRKQRGMSPTEVAFYRDELKECFLESGYVVEKILYRDFLYPGIPGLLVPPAKFLGRVMESLPLVRSISGSLWVAGRVE